MDLTSLTLMDDMCLKLDVDLATPTSNTITATTLNANSHNIIIDAIHILTGATTSSTEVVITTDNQFIDVYKLSDSIAANISQSSIVIGSYSLNIQSSANAKHLP